MCCVQTPLAHLASPNKFDVLNTPVADVDTLLENKQQLTREQKQQRHRQHAEERQQQQLEQRQQREQQQQRRQQEEQQQQQQQPQQLQRKHKQTKGQRNKNMKSQREEPDKQPQSVSKATCTPVTEIPGALLIDNELDKLVRKLLLLL